MNTQWADAAIFHHRRSQPLPQAIADQIRRRIVTGDLAVDRKLPPLRELASLYDVSVPTVHAAVHALAALGLVRITHGVGIFVTRPRSGAAMLNHAFQNATVRELGLMRAAIDEQAAIGSARAVRASPDRVPRQLLDLPFLAAERSTRRVGYADGFIKADLAFHAALASAVPGAEVMASVYRQLAARLFRPLMSTADGCATDDALDAAHAGLADAILAGRHLAAARSMRAVTRRELDALG